MKRRAKFLVICAWGLGAVWAGNTSLFTKETTGTLTLMSHRGVHQEFDLAGVQNDTCTAQRINKPVHNYMENTLPSMKAAIAYGANMVELDIHPTTDGEFAVFHDWTLECRTDGFGKVRDHSASALKALDIGYGYTFDSGETFPFRGQFVGAMPMLGEVLAAFPDTRFLINIKSRSKKEGRLLINYLQARKVPAGQVVVYGHQTPIDEVNAGNPQILTMSKQNAKTCLVRYMALGWSGHMPDACENTWVLVPENYRALIWGWPNRFQARVRKAGSEPVLIGPQTRARANPAIDSLAQLEKIPATFSGVVWTNRIEVIGPAVSGRPD